MRVSLARMRTGVYWASLSLVRIKSLIVALATTAAFTIAAPVAQAAPPGSVQSATTTDKSNVAITTFSYTSTLMNGAPTTVTGMVFEPKVPVSYTHLTLPTILRV